MFLILATFVACTKPLNESPRPELPIVNIINPSISISSDGLTATIITDQELTGMDSLTTLAKQPIPVRDLIEIAHPGLHDSSMVMYANVFSLKITARELIRSLSKLKNHSNQIMVTYTVDTSVIMPKIRAFFTKTDPNRPIEPLFDKGGIIPDFYHISPTIALILPCKGLSVPQKASRLPNAPRNYRAGIHRGIDFFSNWGTAVQSAADGIIIRSDLDFKEVPANFRLELLNRAAKLDRTPSDIFNAVLLGKAVVIDHGFDLFPGYRSITIYAHLSYINPKIKPGYQIKAGEIFAKTGNTGTRASTLGKRDESHLHWELILQDGQGEYYFGQSLTYEKLYLNYYKLEHNFR